MAWVLRRTKIKKKLTYSVPIVVAIGPGQVVNVHERRNQIEQRPGNNHVVIYADKQVDNQLTDANT
jgi:hypothetical protein